MKIFTTVYFVKSVAAVLLLLPLSVGAQTAFMRVVSADGTGDYSTVQAAVDAAASAPIPHRAARLLAGLIRRRNK